MYIFHNDLVIRSTVNTSCLHNWDPNCKFWSKYQENSSIFISFANKDRFRLNGYKFLAYPDNAFPMKWEIAASDDNKTFTHIHTHNEPLCSRDEVTEHPNLFSCKSGTSKEFTLEPTKYYRYFKFTQYVFFIRRNHH